MADCYVHWLVYVQVGKAEATKDRTMNEAQQNQMLNDLHSHLCDKIAVVIKDMANTAHLADLPAKDVISLIFSALSYHQLRLAYKMNMPEKDYVECQQMQYRAMVDTMANVSKVAGNG